MMLDLLIVLTYGYSFVIFICYLIFFDNEIHGIENVVVRRCLHGMGLIASAVTIHAFYNIIKASVGG